MVDADDCRQDTSIPQTNRPLTLPLAAAIDVREPPRSRWPKKVHFFDEFGRSRRPTPHQISTGIWIHGSA
jgi:hypothetical protein